MITSVLLPLLFTIFYFTEKTSAQDDPPQISSCQIVELESLVNKLVSLKTKLDNPVEVRDFLEKDNYAVPQRLCELIYLKEYENFISQNEEVAENPDIADNIINLLEIEGDSEEILRSTLDDMLVCVDADSYVSSRLGFIDDPEIPGIKVISDQEHSLLQLNTTSAIPNVMPELHCTRESCTRRKDPDSCINKIPIVNQGRCGSCWIFAGVLAVELMMCQQYNLVARDFSEGHITDCVGYAACRGGNAMKIMDKISELNNLMLKKDHPYSIPPYPRCEIESRNNINGFAGWRFKRSPPPYNYVQKYLFQDFLDQYDRLKDLIKSQIMEKGSALISIDALEDWVRGIKLSSVSSSEFKKVFNRCNRKTTNHLMVLTGFGKYTDDSGAIREYFEARNSWGTTWGDNGYMRIDANGPPGCNGHILYATYKVDLTPPAEIEKSIYFNKCKTHPPFCQGGGKCVLSHPSRGDSATCECPAGRYGKQCEFKTSGVLRCDQLVCENGGVCEQVHPSSDAKCVCTLGFSGNRCEIVRKCRPGVCSPNESCNYDNHNENHRICVDKRTGHKKVVKVSAKTETESDRASRLLLEKREREIRRAEELRRKKEAIVEPPREPVIPTFTAEQYADIDQKQNSMDDLRRKYTSTVKGLIENITDAEKRIGLLELKKEKEENFYNEQIAQINEALKKAYLTALSIRNENVASDLVPKAENKATGNGKKSGRRSRRRSKRGRMRNKRRATKTTESDKLLMELISRNLHRFNKF